MILRNDETGTPARDRKRGGNSAKIESQTEREVQNKSELNCGTVAILVDLETFVLQLSRGLTLEISRQSGTVKHSQRFESVCLWSGTRNTSFVLDQSCQVRVRSDLE